jgi:hypothetical protein
VSATPRDRKRPALAPSISRLREVALSPPFLLLAACALVAVGAGIVAFHVTAFALDESLIEQSAVHYTSNLPHSLLHDVDARATDRLYSLILSVAFHLFAASNAIRVDHVLSVVLFVSAAAPVYLLATTILRSRAAAAGAAALSVAVPWLALTSALFTENLSYPLFWWMMLAASRSISRPSRLRDLVTLASIGLLIVCRVQFAAVFVGYLVALLVRIVWQAPTSSGTWHRAASAGRQLVQRCTFTAAVVIACIVVLIYERATGQWTQHIETLLGSYSNVVVNKAVPPNMALALGVEVIALALGVGLISALVSIVWYVKSIGSPLSERRRMMLIGLGIILVAFLVLTVFSQLGYLGNGTEERYFFYVIPVFWIGAFAAVEDGNVSAGEIVLCGLAFGFLYGAIPFLTGPFNEEVAFLAPVESISAHLYAENAASLGLGSLTLQDALALLALLAATLTALIWRRWPRLRVWWIAGTAAVVQLLFTGYAYAVMNGDVSGVPGRTSGSVSALGWVDAHARSRHVWWLDNLELAEPPILAAGTEAKQRTTLFWNSRLTSWVALPATGLPLPTWPLAALPNEPGMSIDTSNGLLSPADDAGQIREVVSATDSPFVQLAGAPIAESSDHVLTLIALSSPPRATWLATGLQPNGSVTPGTTVRLYSFVSASRVPRAVRIVLEFMPPPSPAPGAAVHTEILLRFGGVSRDIALSGSAPTHVQVNSCPGAGQSATTGTLTARRSISSEGQAVAGVLERVAISPLGSAGCSHR